MPQTDGRKPRAAWRGAKQHRIWTAETDETGSIGEDIAQDKELTKKLLRQVGVPVPQGRVAQTADEACRIAREIGFPVVLKPRDANHGRGISFDLMTCEGITEAFDHAAGENSTGTTGVIVEQFARSSSPLAGRRRSAHRGDSRPKRCRGRERSQHDRGTDRRGESRSARGENYTDKLDTMALNEAAKLRLKRQGLTPDSILSQGQEIIVCYNGDLTTDETSEVHPAVAERAVLAANCGLEHRWNGCHRRGHQPPARRARWGHHRGQCRTIPVDTR